MPARNKSRARRACPALVALSLALVPTAADAQSCREIRALTNVDGRNFADLSFGIARAPYRVTVRFGRGEALPTPRDCDFSADTISVDIACTWRGDDDAAASALYDALLARFGACLAGLAPASGPSGYGGATALLRSHSTIPSAGGETEIDLALIESAPSDMIPRYRYVSLAIYYGVAEKD